MYHRIADEAFDPWNLAVTPEHFADHMRWAARTRAVLPLSDFARRHHEATLPANALAVTFDDGYACNAETAAPILETLGVPATIFLPVELIRSGRLFWWDELQHIVLDHRGSILRLAGDLIELGPSEQRDRLWPPEAEQRTPRQRSFHALWSRLQPYPPADLARMMDELRSQAAPAPAADPHRLMTAGEARAIASDTIEFGSHAMTHPSLPNLSPAEKKREILDSVAACEALTGATPRTFAYPFGEYDPRSEALVEQAGFACACTTERRAVSASDRLVALPRVQVTNGNAWHLRHALAGLA